MEYIAASMALSLIWIAWRVFLLTRAVIEFINGFRNGPSYVAGNLNISLCQEDRLLLSTPRKRKPRVKSGDAA